VILKKPSLAAILDGRKQIESRFTRTRRAFRGRVEAGDRLFLKQSSGPVWIDKKDWRAWVVLSDRKDFGLLRLPL